MKIAVGYIRCSTDLQEDSPEQQKQEIQNFADRHGYVMTDWFIDFGWSGTTFEMRPEFLRLRRSVESGANFQYVICYDESRWGRAINPEENTYWRVHFERHGIRVVLVKTSIDPDNEFAPMMKAFEGIQASQYSKKLSELTLRGAKANGVYSNGGSAPYGYKREAFNLKTGSVRMLDTGDWSIPSQEKVRWAIGDSNEVDTVRFIFDQRASGKAYILIAEELNRRGVPCARRGRWRNRDQKWSTVTIKTILENPSYYGARIYNRNSMSKIQASKRGKDLKSFVSYPHWRNNPTEWIIVAEAHPPIITHELWLKANSNSRRVDQSRARVGGDTLCTPKNGHVLRSPYLLTGLIRCSKCGFNFQGWSGVADGKRYYKYIDGGWQNKRVCEFVGISKAKLEDFTLNAVKEVISDQETIRDVEEQLYALLRSGTKSNDHERNALRGKVADLRARIGKYLSLFEEGPAGGKNTSESILDRLQELESEKKSAEESLVKLEAAEADQRVDIRGVGELVRWFFRNFEREFDRLPIIGRKQLIRKIVPQIIIDRKRNVASVHVWKIPAVTNQLEELYATNKKALTVTQNREPVSAASSGGTLQQ